MQHSTIAAIATAPGAGGIAIVRLSGPESYEVAAKVFRPANPAEKRSRTPKAIRPCSVRSWTGEEAFDEGVALIFPRAPQLHRRGCGGAFLPRRQCSRPAAGRSLHCGRGRRLPLPASTPAALS
mgnify:CR=1 FL=1